jgi:hypothetical protein
MLTKGCTHQKAAYWHWKQAVDKQWEEERHCLQTAACQGHLDKETARQRWEANCCQQLLDEHAAYKCQETTCRQWLLDKETARRQHLLDKEATRCLMAKRSALAQWMAATQTIFLWHCCPRLHVRLAHQTLR